MKKRALVVGINLYEDPDILDLEYAVNDADEIWAFLKYEHSNISGRFRGFILALEDA